jgi:hypothetical protein
MLENKLKKKLVEIFLAMDKNGNGPWGVLSSNEATNSSHSDVADDQ